MELEYQDHYETLLNSVVIVVILLLVGVCLVVARALDFLYFQPIRKYLSKYIIAMRSSPTQIM